MRIAGGILIIIAAVLDLLGGITYCFGGAFVGAFGAATQQVAKASGEPNSQQVEKDAHKVEVAGGMLALFGVFLLVLSGLGIACAVVLFLRRGAVFALLVGLLQISAEVISYVLWSSVGWTNGVAILAAVFVIVGALSYLGKPAAPVPAQ
jgi:hypothetical protein